MKKIAISFLFALAAPFLLLAQSPLTITESTVKYEKTEYPCIEVTLQPEAKEVKKAWEDFLKDKYDVNLKGIGFLANKDVLTGEEVSFPELSEKQMDFYTKVIEKKGVTTMSVFASFGYDIHLSPDNDYAAGFQKMEDIVREFLAQYLPEYYQESIEEMNKTVDDLEKERTDTEETLTENREKIEELRKEIDNLEKDNNQLEKDLQDKVRTLEEKRQILEARRADFEQVKNKLKIREDS